MANPSFLLIEPIDYSDDNFSKITANRFFHCQRAGLRAAAADGELWNLRVTPVPSPEKTSAFIETALKGREAGHRFAFAVIDEASGTVLGTTSHHDILPEVKRLEIGHTWYAKRAQRTPINTTCKLLLLTHAFDTLGCNVVGWRTDNFNYASQRAIERLGAKKDDVIRGHKLRRDGTIRDTVMYSLGMGSGQKSARILTIC
ncbi:GNAT family N-acetyltransferase [Vreelandella aquamarina]|uniref:GNAT family N-acetyltransferase n=1 Tax=Vreelandella aquamarina TaxID=77097 RepID=UPI001CC333D9|nr:GNAT family protein [Halomonas aquamarina]